MAPRPKEVNGGRSAANRSLSHLDARGRARMVDVAAKAVTRRECVARAEVRMASATAALISEGRLPKGDVLATARIAGIQAAKRTHEWIPLAHPLALDAVSVDLAPEAGAGRVRIEARVRAHARTGVEMEALVAVAAAGLTIYDMCKAIDRGITLEGVRLVRKSGGKSGTWQRMGEERGRRSASPRRRAGTESSG
jgi:cyclic pyranopterin phosphate synthase